MNRCEIIRKKRINIAAFLRTEIDKYNWIEIGSYFVLSDLLTVILYCQLEVMEGIQKKRFAIWNIYYKNHKLLEQSEKCLLPFIPDNSANNIQSSFHNLLHITSQYFKSKHDRGELINSYRYSDCLVRLLLFYRRNR